MKRSPLACVAVFALLSLGGSASAQSALPGDVVANCESCHGARGNSTRAQTPKLNGQTREYLLQRLNELQNLGTQTPHAIDAMWQRLQNLAQNSKQDLRPAIAEYFANQPPVAARLNSAAGLGRQIYENGIPAEKVVACQTCHGNQAQGSGVNPRLAGQNLDYVKSQLEVFNSGLRQHASMDVGARRMGYDQINAVAAYIAGK